MLNISAGIFFCLVFFKNDLPKDKYIDIKVPIKNAFEFILHCIVIKKYVSVERLFTMHVYHRYHISKHINISNLATDIIIVVFIYILTLQITHSVGDTRTLFPNLNDSSIGMKFCQNKNT